LRAKYIDVGPYLRRELFEKTKTVVATSATLRVNRKFDFARRELGVPSGARELVVESPFDFARQAVLVVPEHMPAPSDPAFAEAVADALIDVIALCNGRTLGLFTSYKNLAVAAERVRARFGSSYRVLVQGEAARTDLTRIFKEDVHSVLLGTESFWTGIDVPGEALTAVVIDKLPFPSPDDPVAAVMQERNPFAFHQYFLPKAALKLQQGVGRLIRSGSDIGAVVLLDSRLLAKPYGSRLLSDLPPMRRAAAVADIERFVRGARRCA
jgi:ATP-dependent DNA helicase DinG